MWLARSRPTIARMSDELPWAVLAGPGLILNKDGSLQRSLRVRGPDLESATPASLVAAMARLNNALKRLGTHWGLHVEARRLRADSYPPLITTDPVSRLIDEERRRRFLEAGDHFRTEYTMTFSYLPPEDRAEKAGRAFIENAPRGRRRMFQEHAELFNNQVRSIADLMATFMPQVEFLSDGETLTYLHDCVSFNPVRLSPPEPPQLLDSFLYDTDFLPGLAPRLGDCWLQILAIHTFPSATVPALLDRLNTLPFEYRWTSRFLFLDRMDAEAELARIKRHWFAKRKSIGRMLWEILTREESLMANTDALNKASDADEALTELADDVVSFGYFTPVVIVWDRDPDVAMDRFMAVKQIVDSLGFVSRPETYNGRQAWLSSLPGHNRSNDRRALVSTLNLAHMLPASAIWAGERRNDHLDGPPLLVAQTAGSTPFNLTLHSGDVGHTMIVGPTGAGKSTLLSLMASQFRRYPDAQVYLFDKGRSARAITLGVGGGFYDLGDPDALAFQPLADIDHEDERTWALEWIVDILAREAVTVDADLKAELWSALERLAGRPPTQRTLTLFVSLVQNQAVKAGLGAFTVNGPYGALLDANETTLGYGDWQCFEMEELMGLPGAIVPTLLYVFRALEKRFTGRPTLLILDEAWTFLENSLFAAQIRQWLKTLRKRNVSVVFATQSLADIQQSSIAATLVDACPQRIFLPNDRALERATREAYQQFGLNARQLEILAHAIPKRDYYFQAARGNRLFSLHLGPIGLAFCGASTPDDQRLMTELFDPASPERFGQDWLTRKGLGDPAHALEHRRPSYADAAE
ncbi:MAG: conjugal transfer protein TrbE [Rhodospirillales bacterium]|nr:MAG: conjugal transfer protein TrbE [Rhodospirillales bacterium]